MQPFPGVSMCFTAVACNATAPRTIYRPLNICTIYTHIHKYTHTFAHTLKHSAPSGTLQMVLRVKALKRQVDESEGEVERLEGLRRKALRDAEEYLEQKDVLQARVSALEAELRSVSFCLLAQEEGEFTLMVQDLERKLSVYVCLPCIEYGAFVITTLWGPGFPTV